ncbi:sulfatase-like hydrolase/transferase [Methylobacterium sp. E-016]|uniref:sulfatase-like hydrolase/transferase n=1 Tax=Methylobacterium sp. E-016 TaxID=2836556 RepID=UPI001FB88E1F|nr:sulfatase-like hydrolase/transferase [Methylobacterium sp. E-016]MCJ2077602.1 sulfatase-like hydrolase/transferase [Methylobacterium sp. E-016]
MQEQVIYRNSAYLKQTSTYFAFRNDLATVLYHRFVVCEAERMTINLSKTGTPDVHLEAPICHFRSSGAKKLTPNDRFKKVYFRRFVITLVTVVCLGLVVAGEQDIRSVPFTLACLLSIVFGAFFVSRRPIFSIACGLIVLAGSAFVSAVKLRNMAVKAQVIDLYLYFSKLDVIRFLVSEYFLYVAAFFTLILLGVTVGIAIFYLENHKNTPRWRIGLALVSVLLLAQFSRPAEADTFWYYVRKNHLISSIFASTGDIVRYASDSPLKVRLDNLGGSTPFASQNCGASKRPDIVVVLSESAVAPTAFPEWKAGSLAPQAFHSFDGRTRDLRVETYAGATWISEVQFMTGLSPADLGWRRPYATLFLEGRIRHSLPMHLKACGYRTIAISPQGYGFVNEGAFLKSIGIDEVLDYKAIGAKSTHEPDDVYYNAATKVLKERSQVDNRPNFVFVMTMSAHGPYDYRDQPETRLPREPFGNSPEVDEYLRRLALARSSYSRFLSGLESVADRHGIVVAEFGDHQPIVTAPVIEAREGPDPLLDFHSSAYKTFFSINLIHTAPAAELPPHSTLDLTYLGLTILEVAGLPLGPVFSAQKVLRDQCSGGFHTCPERDAVDAYLGRLQASHLADLP